MRELYPVFLIHIIHKIGNPFLNIFNSTILPDSGWVLEIPFKELDVNEDTPYSV
jgi:hypothetical protein